MRRRTMKQFRFRQQPQPTFSRFTQTGAPGLMGGEEGVLGRTLRHRLCTASTALVQSGPNGGPDLPAGNSAGQQVLLPGDSAQGGDNGFHGLGNWASAGTHGSIVGQTRSWRQPGRRLCGQVAAEPGLRGKHPAALVPICTGDGCAARQCHAAHPSPVQRSSGPAAPGHSSKKVNQGRQGQATTRAPRRLRAIQAPGLHVPWRAWPAWR